MPDTFGALQLPAQIPAAGKSVTDPALDVIGAFCQAVMNKYAGDAWAAVAPESPVLVKSVNVHDPQDAEFSSSMLPGLFLWRSRSVIEYLADDVMVDHATVQIAWVPSPAVQKKRANRRGIFNGVAKTLSVALWNGRDSAFIDAGDTDPDAASRGSVLADRAGLMTLFVAKGLTPTSVEIQVDGGETRKYIGYAMEIEIQEALEFDPSVHGVAPTSVQVDIDEDGLVVDESIDGN